jgi:ketosteroid isomerase-like protein
VESNKAVVRAYFDAVERGDRAALLALFRPDLRWRVPKGAIAPYGGEHRGAERIADLMLGAVGAAFVPGTQHVVLRLVLAEGDVVVAETRMTAKRQKSGGVLAAARSEPTRGFASREASEADAEAAPDYDNDYVFVFELSDGKIAEIREHVDTRYAAQIFGGA